MHHKTNRLALLSMGTAVALVLAYVEVLMPPLYSAIPGIKMGLPNLILVFLLYRFGTLPTAAVSLTRILLVFLLFGNASSLLYSLAGGALSLLVMAVLRRLDFLSVVGVSVAGAVFHNVGQILMAMLVLSTAELGYYLIVLTVTGTIAGILIGLGGAILIKRLPSFIGKD